MKNTKKGFTLVEVLIVVVIIAILAALILPRLSAQTQKAQMAEGLMMFGVIKQAAERHVDVTGSYEISNPSGVISSDAAGAWGGGPDQGAWSMIGISGPERSTQWSYYIKFNPALNLFLLQAQRETPFAFIDYTSYSSGSYRYNCDEEILTNGGNVTKPCRIK